MTLTTEQLRARAAEMKLDFFIEKRAGIWVKEWNTGACVTANAQEVEMWLLLANREAQPVGYIDPDSLKEYRGQRAGGTWSAVQRTTSGLNMTTPIYTAPPEPAPPALLENLLAIVRSPRALPRRKEWVSGQQYSYVLLENVEAMIEDACRAAMLNHVGETNEKVNSPEIPDGWIACSEKMPTPFVDVIASDGKQTLCAHLIENGWWCIASETADEPGTITHWMPLPAAPEASHDNS